MEHWTPGAEYEWVDHWAEMLGLRHWYVWRDGNPSSDPAPRGAVDPDTAADGRVADGERAGQQSPLSAAEITGAAFYMLGALDWADQSDPRTVRQMAARAAIRGSEGVSYHDPNATYQLPGYPGEPLSGLHFISVLYVLIKATAPDVDPGIDLEAPYSMARQMFAAKHRKGEDPPGADNRHRSED